MTALRALLAGRVDYAGLFPPAGLDMSAAVRNYAAYRASDDAWLLGRFVVPVARFDGLVAALDSSGATGVAPWRIAAIAGADAVGDIARVHDFNRSNAVTATVDCVEAKLATRDAIEAAADAAGDVRTFAELPLGDESAPLFAVLRARGLGAKIRTGGVAPDAFPGAREVVRFIRAAQAADVPFKATAGLHHPITSEYALTYEPMSRTHQMYGFVNLSLAAGLLVAGMSDDDACRLLEESDPRALELSAASVGWRGRSLTAAQLTALSGKVVTSFGSCSFREPVDGLRALAPAA